MRRYLFELKGVKTNSSSSSREIVIREANRGNRSTFDGESGFYEVALVESPLKDDFEAMETLVEAGYGNFKRKLKKFKGFEYIGSVDFDAPKGRELKDRKKEVVEYSSGVIANTISGILRKMNRRFLKKSKQGQGKRSGKKK